MNPSIFDWRAVIWASSYPDLDPQKVVIGAGSGCMSCTIIHAAFQSAGLDLRTSDEVQSLSLFRKDENGGLLAIATPNEGRSIVVELYTAQGELLLSCTNILLNCA